jgi:hypothetical protein
MKSIILATLLLIGSASFAQENSCNLWVGEPFESTTALKETAEQYLEMQTKLIPNEAGVKNMYEMRDDNGLAIIKIWMKPKKVVVAGAMTTVYVISSYKITSVSEKIDVLYKAFQAKVSSCTAESSAVSTTFGANKMTIDKQGGDFSKKNIPMVTLTVTAK